MLLLNMPIATVFIVGGGRWVGRLIPITTRASISTKRISGCNVKPILEPTRRHPMSFYPLYRSDLTLSRGDTSTLVTFKHLIQIKTLY
jgi:hypothetical protein